MPMHGKHMMKGKMMSDKEMDKMMKDGKGYGKSKKKKK